MRVEPLESDLEVPSSDLVEHLDHRAPDNRVVHERIRDVEKAVGPGRLIGAAYSRCRVRSSPTHLPTPAHRERVTKVASTAPPCAAGSVGWGDTAVLRPARGGESTVVLAPASGDTAPCGYQFRGTRAFSYSWMQPEGQAPADVQRQRHAVGELDPTDGRLL